MAVRDQVGREGAIPAGEIAGHLERHQDASTDGADRQRGRSLDREQFVVERYPARCGARDVTGAVAQAERHQTGRQAGLDANSFVGLCVQGDEIGADGCDFGKDLHHAVVGGEGRFDRGNAGLVGGEGVAQCRSGCLERQFDHA